jgi:heat shock protein HslJ
MHRLLAALALILCALPAAARPVSGELTYRARVALDPGAQMVIELVGPDGSVTTDRQATGGRQVPVPFRLDAPDTVLRLRAAIVEGGRTTWLTEPVDIPEGTQDVALGPLMLGPYVAAGFFSTYACGREILRAGLAGDSLRLDRSGDFRVLAPVVSASGAKYSDGGTPETVFWSKEPTALVTWDGADLPECRHFPTPDTLSLRATGNEPGWRLDAGAAGVSFTSEPGAQAAGALPEPVLGPAGLTYTPAAGFAVTLSPGPCYDTMTGMPHPVSVTVEAGEGIYLGCGGDPESLIEGSWAVTAIDGTAVAEGTEVTMSFVRGGELGGKAACNRYTGNYRLTGEGLTFGPAAATRMACPGVLMQVETAFLALLPQVTHFDMRDGALLLMAGDRVALQLRR